MTPPSRVRLLYNPLFRAVWIGIIASTWATWIYASASGAPAPAALLVASVNMLTSLPMCLLVLLSVVLSRYVERYGHHHVRFRTMGSETFAVSILTFLGFVGPWVMLSAAIVLGLCAAIATLSLQPALLELLGRIDLPKGLEFCHPALGLGRAMGHLACGVMATLLGPAAIFLLNAIVFGAGLIAGRRLAARKHGDRPGGKAGQHHPHHIKHMTKGVKHAR